MRALTASPASSPGRPNRRAAWASRAGRLDRDGLGSRARQDANLNNKRSSKSRVGARVVSAQELCGRKSCVGALRAPPCERRAPCAVQRALRASRAPTSSPQFPPRSALLLAQRGQRLCGRFDLGAAPGVGRRQTPCRSTWGTPAICGRTWTRTALSGRGGDELTERAPDLAEGEDDGLLGEERRRQSAEPRPHEEYRWHRPELAGDESQKLDGVNDRVDGVENDM